MPSPAVQTISNISFGIVLLGVLTATIVHGVIGLQACLYWNDYPDDRRILRGMICTIMTLEFIHMGFCWHFTFSDQLNSLLHPERLLEPLWTFKATLPVTSITQSICHGFFILRVWILSKRNSKICAALASIDLARLCTSMALTAFMFKARTWLDLHSNHGLFTATFALSVASDFAITTVLSFYLRLARTGSKRTDGMLNSLVYYTISNGASFVVGNIAVLVLFLLLPNNLSYVAALEVVSKLYANSVLSSLNARSNIRKRFLSNGGSTIKSGLPTFKRPTSTQDSSASSRLSTIHPFYTIDDVEPDTPLTPPSAKTIIGTPEPFTPRALSEIKIERTVETFEMSTSRSSEGDASDKC
ncbi:hypothetical protein SISNIDRAFT_484985 [Sistotremastrum niveocremeum HHB9708]|uniref:DUF6534 domain-containing protein n=1 Tax=Sistotremastrum niveocremeum HHB9708 TaxID=1314777 RepID=A0A164VCP2_9AGAM|nr:hypothetical protein SISNIDRAFT_484985 [Sistotremastrum niveocremeum HHB9708]